MTAPFRRVIWIVLDSVGAGEMPDAAAYGDAGSDTLGHIACARRLHLPNLAQLGLGNLKSLPHVGPVERPTAAFGKCALASPGKDTTTGHWEMVGIHLAKPFPLYPNGFPAGIMQEFERQMQLRMGDFSNQVVDPGVTYFPEDFFQLSQNEVFVDCGAYDGDTIAAFRRVTGDRFDRIIAFEPDPKNFAALKSAASGDQRIVLQPYATSARRETLRFVAGDGVGSRVSSTGTCEIESITLDEALDGLAPTYIKFDIEGSEPDALEGGRKTIARHRPKMAVCLYHAPDHLWSIPLRLNELLPDSRFTLRTYYADGFDCVCYCVPR